MDSELVFKLDVCSTSIASTFQIVSLAEDQQI